MNGARHVPGRSSNLCDQTTQITYCVLLQASPLRPGTCRAPFAGSMLLLFVVSTLLTSAATMKYFLKRFMPFDPSLPVNNSLISSSELRNQLNGLKSSIDNVEVELNNAIAGTAVNPAVNVLSQGISNPPTQAQVQAIQNKLNELINAITRPAA